MPWKLLVLRHWASYPLISLSHFLLQTEANNTLQRITLSIKLNDVGLGI